MSSPTSFRPLLLPLEDRSVPAGNVTARVVGGTLFVDGDAGSNSVVIAGTGWRSVAVRPGDAETTINGLPAGQGQFIGDITRGIVVRTGDGEDTVRVEGVRNKHYVGVFTGAGEDEVVLERLDVRGAVEILTDVIPREDQVAADTDDTVRISNSQIRKSLAVNLVGGDDTLTVANSKGRARTSLDGGIGTDTFSRVDNSFFRTTVFRNFETTFDGPIPPPAVPVDPPSVVITSTAPETTDEANIPFTVTFSAPVSGFTINDLGVTNGTPDNFVAVSETEYTFNVIPRVDGTVFVNVPPNAGTDAIGRGNTAADPVTRRSIRPDTGMLQIRGSGNQRSVIDPPDVNDPNFTPTGSGLAVWDVQVGSGTAVAANDQVEVFYTGWLADPNGQVFDARRSPDDPASFTVIGGTGGVIEGFREGLIGMQPGGIRRMRIPPELGYGAAGTNNIPPNSTLIFEVKLVSAS